MFHLSSKIGQLLLGIWVIAVLESGFAWAEPGTDEEAAGQVRQFVGHRDAVACVAFLPDGKRAVSCSKDGELILWDLEGGQELRRSRTGDGQHLALALSPDARRALIGTDRVLELWDIEAGRTVRRLDGASGPVTAVAFDSTGQQAACGARHERDQGVAPTQADIDAVDSEIIVWDVESGVAVRRFKSSGHSSECVALAPNGRFVASGGSEIVEETDATIGPHRSYGVRIWRTDTGEQMQPIRCSSPVRTGVFTG